MSERKASITRATEQTEVRVVLSLDGSGEGAVQTGFPFLDHMLLLFARHGRFNLEVQCRTGAAGSDLVAEEIGNCLGLALDKALGTKAGIRNAGHCYAPVEEHLARAVVEIAGHSCLVYRAGSRLPSSDGEDSRAAEKFWRAFASEARVNLHLELLYGDCGLPASEAIFKAAARALSEACRLPPQLKGSSFRS